MIEIIRLQKLFCGALKYPFDKSNTHRTLLYLLIFALAITATIGSPNPVRAAGSISGVVFHDHNDNGVRDTTNVINNGGSGQVSLAVDEGIGGVTVTAYDPSGTSAGIATSASDGSYTLAATGAGPYRVEFTNLPPGFVSSAHGTGSGTSVQFVPTTGARGVNLGVHLPQDYCQDNPTLATQCYVFGDNTGNTTSPVFIGLPYNAGAQDSETNPLLIRSPTNHSIAVPASQVGTTAGLAYGRHSGSFYTAAFMKKHTGFGAGANPTGAIYRVTSGGAASLLVNLNSLFTPTTAGANPHQTAPCTAGSMNPYDCDNFNVGWDAVGKVALGGVDINYTETFLYVMNLADRNLYRIPLNTPPTAANVIRQQVPLNQADCPNPAVDIRPFAVRFDYFGGVERLYVGMVCSAESTGSVANLRGYVYTVDPGTLAFSAAPAFSLSFNYPRRWVDNPSSAAWKAWTPTFATILSTVSGGVHKAMYPQPWLTDLAFDRGNLILGIRDRDGDQTGRGAPSDPADTTVLWFGISAGDTLRATGNINTGWTLESNGNGSGGAGNAQGPGNGEFYFQDDFNSTSVFHDEVTLGGVAQVPGYPDVAVTVFDPGRALPAITGPTGGFGTGGLRWFSNSAGTNTKGYELYNDALNPLAFNKANGIGLVRAACSLAPVEIGNYVWIDANRNGIQDPGEALVPNVAVDLYDASGTTLVASTTTDANGQYYFSSLSSPLLPNTAYKVVIRPGNFDPGQPLAGLAATINLPAGNELHDSNGVGGTVLPAFPTGADVAAITVGDFGVDDHTIDFGFAQPTTPTPTATNTPGTNATSTAIAGLTSTAISITSSPRTPVPTASNPSLLLSKAADPSLVQPGETIRFTITVTNNGGTAASGIVVTDPVPDAFAVQSASAEQGTFTINGNTVVFSIGTLNPNQTVRLTIVAQVRQTITPPADVVNTAFADYSGGSRLSSSASIRITGGSLPRTGEHPDEPAAPGGVWPLMLAILVAVLAIGALRFARLHRR